MTTHATDCRQPSLPLSNAHLQQLAQCLENILAHFHRYQSARENPFMASIHVIADCYRLVFLTLENVSVEDHRLQALKQSIDFKQAPEVISKLASTLAEMISHVADQVRLMDHPWFYDPFATAIQEVLHNKATYLCEEADCLNQLRALILPAARRQAI